MSDRMDEQKQPPQTDEPEPKRSEEPVEDLEPAPEETEGVKGGDAINLAQDQVTIARAQQSQTNSKEEYD